MTKHEGHGEHSRTQIVEMLGLAGTGKTVALSHLTSMAGIDGISTYRHPVRALAYVRGSVEVLPAIAVRARAPVGPRELRRIARLEAGLRVAHRARSRSGKATVFDQGPVFTMARLIETLGDPVQIPEIRVWWSSTVERWSTTLDLLVWLDAPNDVLLERIRRRIKTHRLERLDDAMAARALDAERDRLGSVVRLLARPMGPSVVRIDTATNDAVATAAAVHAAIDRFRSKGGRTPAVRDTATN